MLAKKGSLFLVMSIMVFFSIIMSGCYTQLSRPGVDTDYYPEEDEKYESDYYSGEEEYREVDDIDYYNIYLYGGAPIFYGPHAWRYWSPYYRFNRHASFYDPWWSDYDYWRTGIYDPFYDPWYGYWSYTDYYYYHPRNHYYWTYEGGRNYQNSRPMRQRETIRRDAYQMPKVKKKRVPSGTPERIRKQVEQNINQGNVKRSSINEPRKRNVEVPKTRRTVSSVEKNRTSKRRTPPATVERRKAPDSNSKPERVKRSTPSKSSKGSQAKQAPRRSRSTYKAPAPQKKSSPAPSKSSSSKKSTPKKSKSE